ncbi:MAG: hypothetical protein IJC15_02850 [Clostridia bacterium]|nr:hypothetical protein [Clostridia bacterium]
MKKFQPISRRQAIFAALCAFTVLLSGAGLVIGAEANRRAVQLDASLERLRCETATQIVRLSEEISAMPPRAAKEYLVRRCADGIGIYDGTGSVLYELLDVDVRSLPAADRAMLEMGILVTGEAALRALTEDYSS